MVFSMSSWVMESLDSNLAITLKLQRYPLPVLLFILKIGSLETGTKVYQTAAKDLKKVTMELGGKSPLILFEYG